MTPAIHRSTEFAKVGSTHSSSPSTPLVRTAATQRHGHDIIQCIHFRMRIGSQQERDSGYIRETYNGLELRVSARPRIVAREFGRDITVLTLWSSNPTQSKTMNKRIMLVI